MSEVRRCDKCNVLINAQDAWTVSFQILKPDDEPWDDDTSDLCEKCKDKAFPKLVKAINE